MVKIDLITGFLGSGKTTFIKEYAGYLISKGEKICIIENDYGAVNIDMVMLQDLLSDNCNLEMIVGGDGKEAHRRRFRTKLISMGMSGYDRVLIEPSGIYDVDEFFDVLYDEPLDRWYEIGNVISLVDAGAVFYLGDFERYIFMSEIASAGKLVFSKLDMVSDKKAVLDAVNKIMDEFGGKSFDMSKDIVAKPIDEFTPDDFEALCSCGYRHASYVKLPIEDKQFTPLFYFDVAMPLDKLREIAKGLLTDAKAGHVIRIKGFVQISENEQTELNATEKEIKTTPIVSSRNVLIVIGEGLDKAYINSIFKDYCSVVSL
ncbi:GTP-binding protein [Butyrivibrio sp. NC2007]|uniref:GTP-binding protein n=1 Tax=Butyrivibrio sp. NC2007 TaxID=1280683 RepID=UPI0003B6239C|nr:GTP-binding protein [Butyrivibrio sp. NC2007]